MNHRSPRQEAASLSLQALDIFRRLEAYASTLTGMIPLDIDIENSDLDLICCAAALESFASHLTTEFRNEQGFQIAQKIIRGEPCVVAKFEFQGFPIEIFAQNCGESARQEIRRLKTEPAFARYFHLAGDPYEVLYQMSFLREDELSLHFTRKHVNKNAGL